MCKVMEIQRDAVPSNILIEFERDASMRCTDIVIINRDRHGAERQGMRLVANDNGTLMLAAKPQDLVDGVDLC